MSYLSYFENFNFLSSSVIILFIFITTIFFWSYFNKIKNSQPYIVKDKDVYEFVDEETKTIEANKIGIKLNHPETIFSMDDYTLIPKQVPVSEKDQFCTDHGIGLGAPCNAFYSQTFKSSQIYISL